MHARRNFVFGAVLAAVLVVPTLTERAYGTVWSAKSDASLLAAKAWMETQATASVQFGARAANWLWHQIQAR